MERLTYDFCVGDKHCWQVKGADNLECREVCRNQGENGCTDCPIAKAFDRLAAYEDTGLEPEEIRDSIGGISPICVQCDGKTSDGIVTEKCVYPDDITKYLEQSKHLCELAQAEKEGRLVVLPAEKIFELTWDAGPNCDLICPVSINGVGQCDFCENGKLYIYERTCRQEHIEHVGKTVFLTREAAEAALKEREAEHE